MSWRNGTRGLVLAALSLAAPGCDATPLPTPSAPAPQATAAAPADCEARIAAADLADEATILAVDQCRFTPEGREASRAALEAGAIGGPLWAAIWVYAASGADPAPLRPVLQSVDDSARVMAAAALVGFGDGAGFESLRAALASTEIIAGSKPPMPADAFAAATLEGFVTGDDLPASIAAWDAWLAANAALLVFDDDAGTWSLP